MVRPEEVLSFWLDEVGPKGWYEVSDVLDETIRNRFMSTWEKARDGGLGQWLTYASGTLAYLIVTDQFPRNMFRGSGTAFATDRKALCAAKSALHKKWDQRIDGPARQFFFLPLMHSENLCDQEQCVRMFVDRMKDCESNLLHAQAHREVIRQFGRFPYRNAALARPSTELETAYVEKGGYGHTVRLLQAAQ
ncbi:DUF924 domain-containing protein [Shimia sp. R9_1]|uniref:DUF924 family protein n=1 Tax=unclassified Shimia TaxID=2630038 RepID=UPI001AD963BE|nr:MULTISPECIES: DUF924 family protein [unclassified Shimia]MBO9396849.1 DUF924 domain-containing protein [Shimia sp. R9_2]MBO9401704.1 DUF924 domain-containing protein [Shimia sp. R9_3]MBO9408080.1 DUF924 domain-containing protein [Shimia sp. R9_1]